MSPHLPVGALPLIPGPGDDAPYDPSAFPTENTEGDAPTWEGKILVECTDGSVWEWKSFMGRPNYWAPRTAYPVPPEIDSTTAAKARLREAVTNRFRISGAGTCPDPHGPWKDILIFAANQIREVERLSGLFFDLRQTMASALGFVVGDIPPANAAITALLNERTSVIRGLMSMINRPTVSPDGSDLSYGLRLDAVGNDVCHYIMEQRATIRGAEARISKLERELNEYRVAADNDAGLWAKAGLTPNPEGGANG